MRDWILHYRIIVANSAMAALALGAVVTLRTQLAAAVAVILAAGAMNALLVRVVLRGDALRRQQRELYSWLLREAEAERMRVADEIRESAAQRLAALVTTVRDESVRGEARAVMQQLVDTAETLRPPRLELLGLEGALEWHARVLEGRHAVAIAVSTGDSVREIDARDTIGVYRLCEDVLDTLARCDARSLNVRIAVAGDVVTACIGVTPAALTCSPAERFRLTERAACLGGNLVIEHCAEDTLVRITVPVTETHGYDPRTAG